MFDSKIPHKMWKGIMGMRLVMVIGHTNLRNDEVSQVHGTAEEIVAILQTKVTVCACEDEGVCTV